MIDDPRAPENRDSLYEKDRKLESKEERNVKRDERETEEVKDKKRKADRQRRSAANHFPQRYTFTTDKRVAVRFNDAIGDLGVPGQIYTPPRNKHVYALVCTRVHA